MHLVIAGRRTARRTAYTRSRPTIRPARLPSFSLSRRHFGRSVQETDDFLDGRDAHAASIVGITRSV